MVYYCLYDMYYMAGYHVNDTDGEVGLFAVSSSGLALKRQNSRPQNPPDLCELLQCRIPRVTKSTPVVSESKEGLTPATMDDPNSGG